MMTEEMIAWVRDNLQVLLHSPAHPTPTPTPTLTRARARARARTRTRTLTTILPPTYNPTPYP